MTATTYRSAERRALESAAHRRGVKAVAWYYVVGTWYVGVWFWAIALAVGALILWIMHRNDDVSIEAVGGVAGSAKFFLAGGVAADSTTTPATVAVAPTEVAGSFVLTAADPNEAAVTMVVAGAGGGRR